MSRFKEITTNILKEIAAFLSSGIFLKNLAGMAGLVAILLFASFIWMRQYTHHGESLKVPDFLNMEINDAIEDAKKKKLRLIINDSIWSDDKPAGTITEQSPAPNSRVKKNRTIYATITKFRAEEKQLPPLAGNDNYNYYARRLKQLKINLVVRKKVFDNKLQENTILYLYVDDKKVTGEDLKKGVAVPQGATVEAVVTTRGGGMVNIPNLVCKKYSEAEFLINGSQLSVSVVKDGTIESLNEAYVWKQSPSFAPGQSIRVGSPVTIYLTRYPPADCN